MHHHYSCEQSQTRRNGWHAWIPQKPGEMAQQKPCEVQQRQMVKSYSSVRAFAGIQQQTGH